MSTTRREFLRTIAGTAALGLPTASLEWQPHLLAASVHFLHGRQSLDFPAVQQAREALAKNG